MAAKPPPKAKPSSTKNPKARKSASAGVSTSKSKATRPPSKQQKTKPGQMSSSSKPKKKKRVYTEKELKLPALNMITPAGVTSGPGKKKGKVFVDDQEGMMTIMALVNAEKEGQIESKMIKARQLEEIREARRKEAEVREQKRREKFEDVKKDVKRKGKTDKSNGVNGHVEKPTNGASITKKTSKKRVSFA